MTKERLAQVRHLRREAAQHEARLRALERQAREYAQAPWGGGTAARELYGELLAQTERMCRASAERLSACNRELQEAAAFIGSIGDSLMRQVFALRYLDGLSWTMIAARTGMEHSAEALRQRHGRYLRKHGGEGKEHEKHEDDARIA